MGETGIKLINTTKIVTQIVTSDHKRKEADLDWERSIESLSEEIASELRAEQKGR